VNVLASFFTAIAALAAVVAFDMRAFHLLPLGFEWGLVLPLPLLVVGSSAAVAAVVLSMVHHRRHGRRGVSLSATFASASLVVLFLSVGGALVGF
jgi:hypothetical protein